MFDATALVREGCVTAIVSDNKDEEKLGRVKVKINAGNLLECESDWIYCINKSPEQGYWLPNIGDRVVVGSIDGNSMAVFGSIPKKDQKAIVDHADDSDNNIKKIKTKAGIEVTVNDTEKSVDIITPDGRKIFMSDQDKTVEVSDGKNSIKLNEYGVEANSGKDLKLIAGNAKLTFSSSSIELAFGSNKITLDNSGVAIDGGMIKISAKTTISNKVDGIFQIDSKMAKVN